MGGALAGKLVSVFVVIVPTPLCPMFGITTEQTAAARMNQVPDVAADTPSRPVLTPDKSPGTKGRIGRFALSVLTL